MATLRVIDDDEARALFNRAEAAEIVVSAYCAAAEGKADVSTPSALFLRGLAGTDTSFKIKGAVLDTLKVAGFRLRSYGSRTTDTTSAYLCVLDSETGQPLGLVSEAWLHRLRTATTGLVACRTLLTQEKKRLALIGTGRIAEEFVRVCPQILPQVDIVLTSRSVERAQATATRWQSFASNPLSAAPIRDALAGADVVVTLSDAAEVLFSASDLTPHALVCAMGGRYEFDRDVLDTASTFVVDEMDFVCASGSASYWIRSGQLVRNDLESRLDATIGEILLGRKSIEKNKRTLAIIQGMAVCDLAFAKIVLDRASQEAGPRSLKRT